MHKYDTIRNLMAAQGSKITSVEFIKKDGSLRTMLVQDAATKYRVKGEHACEQARKAAATRKVNNPNLLNVYDIQKDAIRSINMDTVIKIKGSGKEIYHAD